MLQYFRSLELYMDTFPVCAGDVLILFVKHMIKWQCSVILVN